ncbi:MAG TPA: hypothetical protein V6D18_03055 [Thermosynechococcaceae cyanobacterium]
MLLEPKPHPYGKKLNEHPPNKEMKSKSVYFKIATALLTLIGIGQIALTYPVLSQTWDEPAHIGRGIQWWGEGKYTYDLGHPPLAPVMASLVPYFTRLQFTGADNRWDEGNAVLHQNGTYQRNLTLARLGTLPFFILTVVIVSRWSHYYFGSFSALLAVFWVVTLPPILANAGLAATDMACAGTLMALLFTFCLWLKAPTHRYGVWLGVTGGLACLAKYSNIVFFLVSILSMGVLTFLSNRHTNYRKEQSEQKDSHKKSQVKRWMTRFVRTAIALLICGLIIWAGYRFSVISVLSPEGRPHTRIDRIVGQQGLLHDVAYFAFERLPIPAPEFIKGLTQVKNFNEAGHTSYLLGEAYKGGRWYFFPIEFLIRTPIPFLLLAGFGIFSMFINVWKRRLDPQILIPPSCALGIMAIAMTSHLNLGVRHILPIYPLLAIVAGYGATRLWKIYPVRGPAIVSVLLVWQILTAISVNPDYLAYYNSLAGKYPEEISIGTTDWGQDFNRLVQVLKRKRINEMSLCYAGSVDFSKFDLPSWKLLNPYEKTKGWVLSSLLCNKIGTWEPPYDQFAWLEQHKPVETIGKSIKLYYIIE